ncbi:putative ArsR family transcriptional regulator [Amycolatopsis jiangsuensis]|uniref:Putative ArsR family transcriptional regulator n=1 Tax=Amycolatopsis jiangsuensis TaxID=1181879 RepID=A0A840ISQ7_9PSEU|nr:putative ArsR family transcriptional regulator [Amycolatopsis jiangsuensis]
MSSAEGRTRHEVARLLLEQGPMTAAVVAEQLGISPTAVRRHLDALVADGEAETRDAPRRGPRGRGRPARLFLLTETGRARFGHAYDDLAVSAVRFLAEHAGPDAVRAFAESRVDRLVGPHRAAIAGSPDPASRAEALATALTREGYAASTREVGSTGTAAAVGAQLCQHHCPVAHVAAEFPQLCEAETEAFARLLGTHVQRLATIARGDNACTTHVPAGSAGIPAHPEPDRTTAPAAAPPPREHPARIPNGGKPA